MAFLLTRLTLRVDSTFPGPSLADPPYRYMRPSHRIFFGALLRGPGVEDILCVEGYEGVGQGGSRIEGDGRRGGGLRD